MSAELGARDAGRADRARQLAAARRRLFLTRTSAGLVALWALEASGLSGALWAWLADAAPAWVALGLFAPLLMALLGLCGLPFAWAGYQLSRRYELSRQQIGAWLADWLKAAALGVSLSSLAIWLFYVALAISATAWWALVAAAGTLAMLLLTFVAPYVLVPIFYRMRPLEDAALAQQIQELGSRARAEIREVCTLDFSRKTAEANAAVIGLGRSRRVVLADTLLREFPVDEIRSVVAHEIGHHVRRDVPRLLAVQAALLWAGLALAAAWGDPALLMLGSAGGLAAPGSLPLLLLGSELYGLLTTPLSNALSRRLESEADRFALELTDDPVAFEGAMCRLADQNLAESQPPRWAELLLYTHPPIARRLAAARAWCPRAQRGSDRAA